MLRLYGTLHITMKWTFCPSRSQAMVPDVPVRLESGLFAGMMSSWWAGNTSRSWKPGIIQLYQPNWRFCGGEFNQLTWLKHPILVVEDRIGQRPLCPVFYVYQTPHIVSTSLGLHRPHCGSVEEGQAVLHQGVSPRHQLGHQTTLGAHRGDAAPVQQQQKHDHEHLREGQPDLAATHFLQSFAIDSSQQEQSLIWFWLVSCHTHTQPRSTHIDLFLYHISIVR